VAEKIIGVLGGLGPWATLDLFEKILRLTPAQRDQDHLRIIIDNNPKIPDRQSAILGDGEDPTPALVATARNLEAAGAGFADVVKMTVYLLDIKNHQWPVRNVRAEFIDTENPPVSTMVEVSRLAIDGMLIEVDVVAAQ